MATLAGYSSVLSIPTASPNVAPFTVSGIQVGATNLSFATGGSGASVPFYGAVFSRNEIGFKSEHWGGTLWFEHMHLVPTGTFTLGNVLTTTTRGFDLFNGFRKTSKTVTSIIPLGFDGLSITAGDSTPPVVLPPKGAETYEITIDRLGPANLSATLEFVTSTGESLKASFTGNRVIVFPFVPQWPVKEDWGWLTEVISSVNGTEQRIGYRDLPRQTVRYKYLIDSAQTQSLMDNQLWDWMGRIVAIPMWLDQGSLASSAAATTTVLTLDDISNLDFRDAGRGTLLLLWSSETVFETGTISSISGNQITLGSGLISTFPAGTLVYPLRLSYVNGEPRQTLYANDVAETEVIFDIIENKDFADETGFTTYLSLPVYEDDQLIESLTYQRTINKKLNRVDSGTGRMFQNSRLLAAKVTRGLLARADTRARKDRLRGFLHARRGMQKAFWMPTNRRDFQVAANTSATDTIQVLPVNYEQHVEGHAYQREHIMIEYADGTKDYRRITVATENVGVEETLILDSATSQAFSTTNVVRISYLSKRRLASDKVSFDHSSFEEADISLSVVDLSE